MLIFLLISQCFILIVGMIAFAPEPVATMAIVTATRGHDAALSCKLTHHKKVLQVTWKKITPSLSENVATYSRYGAVIAKPFQEHVQFLDTGLHKSSLLIKGVGRDSEACYSCIFYSYPNGAISSTACLKVYELNGPVTEVREIVSHDDHIRHELNCFNGRASNLSVHVDNNQGEGSVGSVGPSLESSVSVIKASVGNGQDLTCIVGSPPVPKREHASMIIGEPQMIQINGNGRLTSTLSFVIFVTGLSTTSLIY